MSKIKQFFANAAGANPMDRIQTAVERIILYSRYILVVFYIGLAVALAIYAVSFIFEVIHLAEVAFFPPGNKNMIMPVLELIDGALVSGLIVMVMLSSYENFVGLLTISAVKLLQVFMDREDYTDADIFWKVIIHVVFIASAVFLALLDRIAGHTRYPDKADDKKSNEPPAPL
jgi:uncharacterized membrane protein YqhA